MARQSPNDHNLLFGAFLATSLSIFLINNLLFLNREILISSAVLMAMSFGVICCLYFLSCRIGLVGSIIVLSLSLGLVGSVGLRALRIGLYLFTALAVGFAVKEFRLKATDWLRAGAMGLIAALTTLRAEPDSTLDLVVRIHQGLIGPDILFHSSIASMFKNYGVISTGLNGLVKTPYHVFSHILISSISVLTGQSIIQCYAGIPGILFSPLLIVALVYLISWFRDPRGTGQLDKTWFVTCFFLSIAPFLGWRWALWDSYFVSESYQVSLVFFLIGLTLVLKEDLTPVEEIWAIILSALAGFSKGSVGLVFVVMWFFRATYFPKRFFRRDLWIGLISGLAVVGVTLNSFFSAKNNIPIEPFHFLSYVQAPLLSSYEFFLFHFLTSWWGLAIVLFKSGFRGLKAEPLASLNLVCLLGSIAVVCFLSIPGGSAYYFTNLAFFISLPIVVPSLLAVISRADQRLRGLLGLFGVLGVCYLAFLTQQKRLAVYHSAIARPQNEFVNKLLMIRRNSDKKTIFKSSPEFDVGNPTPGCVARPFMYPALSERPWAAILYPASDCKFQYYGFESYPMSHDKKSFVDPPTIKLGMKTLGVEF